MARSIILRIAGEATLPNRLIQVLQRGQGSIYIETSIFTKRPKQFRSSTRADQYYAPSIGRTSYLINLFPIEERLLRMTVVAVCHMSVSIERFVAASK